MTRLLPDWTTEKIIAFAPDKASVKASQKLAKPQKWPMLGHDTRTAWGAFQGSGKNPYQVKLDLLRLQQEETGYHCSCPSRKQPCKHALALLFILVEAPETVAQGEPPDFVKAWLDKVAEQTRKREARKQRSSQKQADPKQQAKTIAARQAKILAGLTDLEPWLLTIMRHGLADSQLKSHEFWEVKAARMVDAQAPGVAHWLRDMAAMPNQDKPAWLETLLAQLGQLYLLIQSFKRFDALSPEAQADLRSVVGWHHRQEEVLETTPLADQWLVMGRQESPVENRLRLQRGWLRGQNSQRDALIMEFAFGDAPFETRFHPGQWLDAELVYFPSRYPLRAFIQKQTPLPNPPRMGAGCSIQTSLERYAEALALNPWLRQFPFFLEAVIPTRLSGRWIVREVEGDYLPLSSTFGQRWALLSLGGHQPIQLLGEWDGQGLLPLGAVVDGRFVDFSQIGAI